MLLASWALAAELQRVTVLVRDAPAAARLVAVRGDTDRIVLTDPGEGVLTGTFEGPPARLLSLRLLTERDGHTVSIFEGLVPLAEREDEVVSFRYRAKGVAVRVAAAPPLDVAAGGVAGSLAGRVALAAVAVLWTGWMTWSARRR